MDQSSSDDEYEENERILLEDLNENEKTEQSGKNHVFDFDEEDDEEEGGSGASDIDMGSDLEDRKEYMPDDRAWGNKRRNFYNTDFDKDYSGAYGADDAEIAEMEEQEARNIQKRLMEQLSDADFSLADIADTAVVPPEDKSEAIQSDLTLLSKRQKLDMFRKESPEFAVLVDDFEAKLTEAREKIVPVLKLIKEGKLAESPAGEFLKTKYRIVLNYCTNIVFYMLLKTKKIPTKDHPVLKTLFRYRQLLQQLETVDEDIIKPQVDKILAVFDSNVAAPEEDQQIRKRRKLLKILKKSVPKRESTQASHEGNETQTPELANDSESENNDNGKDEMPADQKRAITYEMAKNKGLTPKRSKEQRNPRVKHRNKFRKSLIRRRGQVRTPRTEIPLYAGEPTGIKIGLKKGRKIM